MGPGGMNFGMNFELYLILPKWGTKNICYGCSTSNDCPISSMSHFSRIVLCLVAFDGPASESFETFWLHVFLCYKECLK